MHLSVIIPTLKKVETATLLAGRIRELLPGLDIEVIVVTPASSDEPISCKLLRYVADSGKGVYAAYKTGLGSACGDYIWFMGDDDYPLDAATCITEILRAGAVDLVIAPVLFSSGRVYRPTRSLLTLHFLNWCQQGVVYRRSVLVRHKFFRRLTVQADQYVNILLRSDPTVSRTFLKQPICVFGVNGVSGHSRDTGYKSIRIALARRSLKGPSLVAFRLLTLIEPLVKRLIKVR